MARRAWRRAGRRGPARLMLRSEVSRDDERDQGGIGGAEITPSRRREGRQRAVGNFSARRRRRVCSPSAIRSAASDSRPGLWPINITPDTSSLTSCSRERRSPLGAAVSRASSMRTVVLAARAEAMPSSVIVARRVDSTGPDPAQCRWPPRSGEAEPLRPHRTWPEDGRDHQAGDQPSSTWCGGAGGASAGCIVTTTHPLHTWAPPSRSPTCPADDPTVGTSAATGHDVLRPARWRPPTAQLTASSVGPPWLRPTGEGAERGCLLLPAYISSICAA